MASLTQAQIAQLAYQADFRGSSIPTITAIIMAESGGNTNAVHVSNIEHSVGLAQINLKAHPTYNQQSLLNPLNNLKAAYAISNGGTNFNPWTTFTSGIYQQFLGTATSASSGLPTVNLNSLGAQNTAYVTNSQGQKVQLPSILTPLNGAEKVAQTTAGVVTTIPKLIGDITKVGWIGFFQYLGGSIMITLGLIGLFMGSGLGSSADSIAVKVA